MKLTKFEQKFLRTQSDEKCFVAEAVYWFHLLLMKVEADPYRQWNHDLLRNYVDAFYELSLCINERNDSKGNPNKKEINFQKPINIYTDADSNLTLFFTGLYSPKSYQGLKNGLYFVYDSEHKDVLTRKEILQEDKYKEVKDLLSKIIHRDSFENELWNNKDLEITEISTPKKLNSQTAYNDILNAKNGGTILHGWLHILYDGSNNLPTEFVKSFFCLGYECVNLEQRNAYRKTKIEEIMAKAGDKRFEFYQQILTETFESQIKNKDEFPIMFYKKESRYNYLLPMYLQNSTKPDFCIVLGKKENDSSWQPMTSLNMDEVYCNIRIFGKDAILSVRNWW